MQRAHPIPEPDPLRTTPASPTPPRRRRARPRALLALVAIAGALTAPIVAMAILNPVFVTLPAALLRDESLSSVASFGEFLFGYLEPTTRTVVFEDGTGVVPLASAACVPDDADLFDCGQRAWHRGEFRASVSYFERLVERDGESEQSLFWLAMAYLRLAEKENCLEMLLAPPSREAQHPHAGMCTLPLERYHRDKSAIKSASLVLTKLLDDYGPDPLYQWLLNFSAMPAEEFPSGVPERYVLPEDNFFRDLFYGERRRAMEQKYADLHFRDVAAELRVDYSRQVGAPDAGRGVAVEDFNGDGCLDIVTIGGYISAAYFENACGEPGELAFVDRSIESGIATSKGGHIATAADYDDDGFMDVLITRDYGSPRGDVALMRNQGDGTFRDVSVQAGLRQEGDTRYDFSWVPAWGDIDNDGDLDLFISKWQFYNVNYKKSWTHNFFSLHQNVRSTLYRNDNGHFVDVTDAYGIADATEGHNLFGAAFGDYDADGRIDLAVGRLYTPGVVLFRNTGERFVRVEEFAGDGIGFMTAFVDTNGDGKLDLFAGGMGAASSITQQVVFQRDKELYNTGPRLWVQKSPTDWQLDRDYFDPGFPIMSMGVGIGDLNHDGALDWYLGTGNPEGWFILPNLMMMGRPERGDGPGTDNISMLQGFGTIQKGHGIVFADFDRDGDQDIYSSLGGYWPGDAWPNQLFRNDSETDNRFVELRLHGCRANRNGLGSTLAVHTRRANGATAVHHYHMDNKSSFGSAPYVANIGLGDAVAIERIDVRWLGPGPNQVVSYRAPIGRLSVLAENGGVFASVAAAEASCDREPAIPAEPSSATQASDGGHD